MEDIVITPTQHIPIKRGRRAMPQWYSFRLRLTNPLLKDGQWYEIDLKGLSFTYARKQAIQRGFTTAPGEDGKLKIMFPTP